MLKFTKATVFALIAMLGLGFTAAQAGTAKNGYDKQKAVYHVNNIHSATGALRNIMGKKSPKTGNVYDFRDQIAGLANRGVKFDICANTIRGKKIDKSKINENAEIVPSGVAEVVALQQKGYYYVKP